MAGKFEIHPTGGTTIVCDTLDSIDTSEYLLMSQDLKESDREKIIYSEGRFDGSVISSTASIVTAEFVFLVNGDTPEEIATNVATVKAAFFNIKGGYIEYRPVGYSASILTTFYKFLQSPPPQRLREADAVQSSIETTFAMGQLYRFQVKIFSLATSNPDSPSTIASGDIYTFLEDGDNANRATGCLAIPSSGIKGDGFIAYIELAKASASGVTNISPILAHIYEVTSGNDADELLNEAKSGFSSFTDSGRHVISSQSSASLVFPENIGGVGEYSPDIYGKVIPVFSYIVTDGTWEYSISQSGITLVDYTVLAPSETPPEWSLEIGETFNFPYFHLPPGMVSGRDISLNLRTTDSSSKTIAIYGLLLLKVDGPSWIAKLESKVSGGGLQIQNVPLVLDGHDGSNYLISSNVVSESWSKSGNSLRDMVFPKSDYQIRTLTFPNTIGGPGTILGWHHSGPNRINVTVKGMFYTVYPFAEA
jgi:hypothetical protein